LTQYDWPDKAVGKQLIEEFSDDAEAVLQNQDWDYVYPQPKGFDKYVLRYQAATTTAKEKRVLTAFIMQAGDDLLTSTMRNLSQVEQAIEMLLQDREITAYELNYWCLWENSEQDDRFLISELVRARASRLGVW